MWKYLIINGLWFAILMFVHLAANRTSQRLIFFCLISAASILALTTTIDPFAWAHYLVYSVIIYVGARSFRQWVYSRSMVLEEEIEIFTNHGQIERKQLEDKQNRISEIQKKAHEMMGLFDKTKEMSQGLDYMDVLVVFGEALSKNFPFQFCKLAVFDEKIEAYHPPVRLMQVLHKDFDHLFDRVSYVKERQKAKTDLFPLEKQVMEKIFFERENFYLDREEHTHLLAVPIFLDKKVVGVLMISNFDRAISREPMFQILMESFKRDFYRLKLYEQVETLAITDGLTGSYVRRHLMERLEGEIDRCKRFGLKLAFLMIDVDYFKRFNDDYGHLVGDVVLKQVAAIIKRSIREVDLAGRYGGEEFGVLLVETDEQSALLVAERIRRSVSEHPFRAYDENLIVTVSVGCSMYSRALADSALIVEAADSALYQAKRQGRDRVCLYSLTEGETDKFKK